MSARRTKDRSARRGGSSAPAAGTAQQDLTDDEIVQMQDSMWAPSILGDAIDVIVAGVAGNGVDFSALARLLGIVLGMYVVAALFSWLQGRLLNDIVMRIVFRLRQRIEAKINRLPLRYFDTRQRGDLLSRTTNDVDNVQTAPPSSTRCSRSWASR